MDNIVYSCRAESPSYCLALLYGLICTHLVFMYFQNASDFNFFFIISNRGSSYSRKYHVLCIEIRPSPIIVIACHAKNDTLNSWMYTESNMEENLWIEKILAFDCYTVTFTIKNYYEIPSTGRFLSCVLEKYQYICIFNNTCMFAQFCCFLVQVQM